MTDPLLAFPAFGQGYRPEDRPGIIEEIKEENNRINEHLERLQRDRVAVPGQAPAQAKTWDEIDGIMRSMTEQEVQVVTGNDEYKESEAVIQGILQREYLRVMRPMVENTKDGKDALEKHLTLVKRLRKSAKEEAGKRYALMDEYLSKYTDMPFNEFLAKKKGGEL